MPIRHLLSSLLLLAFALFSLSCSRTAPDPNTLVMIIESSPANLDPRVGTDAQSQHIGQLIFDSLLRRDENFQMQPGLAERWEIRDPLTYVFYLRKGVRFHDGAPLTARDVKWTFDSVRNGEIISAKSSTYRFVQSIGTPDDHTVIFRLTRPFAALLWNVSGSAMGIVPYGSGKDFNRKLIGSGPFRFVSAAQDSEVIIARNDDYWGEKPKVERVRFAVVPDTTTRVLELKKGSADIASNSLTADMVERLRQEGELEVQTAPGTIYAYIAFNLRDPLLSDVRVRQALAYAIDRRPMIDYIWRGLARPANSVLPPEHWAYTDEARRYDYNPERAKRLLDAAGYPVKEDGVRFRLTMKTSTEETTRLMAAVLQQQLREVGIGLDIRSFEFATFYSDVVKGAFQFYSLRWIGGNEDPDIFEHVFHSASFPPKRANRGYYSNPRVDSLIELANGEPDQGSRAALYRIVQKVVADEVPYVNLWYYDNVLVHSRRVKNLKMWPSGNYDFLLTAEMVER